MYVNLLKEVPMGALERGELAVVLDEIKITHKGRKDIKLREYGDSWLPWCEAGAAWGARVDMVICERDRTRELVKRNFPEAKLQSFRETLKGGLHRYWTGILCGVAHGPGWGGRFVSLIRHTRPACTIVAIHGQHSRRTVDLWLPGVPDLGYRQVSHSIRHADVGGVTEAVWKLRVYFLKGAPWESAKPIDPQMPATPEPGDGDRRYARLRIQTRENRTPQSPAESALSMK